MHELRPASLASLIFASPRAHGFGINHLATGGLGLALLQVVEVLDYPARVVDHLFLVDQDGDPPLSRELVNLVAIAAAHGDPDLLVVDPRTAEPACHLAARTEPVRRRLAAV